MLLSEVFTGQPVTRIDGVDVFTVRHVHRAGELEGMVEMRNRAGEIIVPVRELEPVTPEQMIALGVRSVR